MENINEREIDLWINDFPLVVNVFTGSEGDYLYEVYERQKSFSNTVRLAMEDDLESIDGGICTSDKLIDAINMALNN